MTTSMGDHGQGQLEVKGLRGHPLVWESGGTEVKAG
jgi:hypothetical protein